MRSAGYGGAGAYRGRASGGPRRRRKGRSARVHSGRLWLISTPSGGFPHPRGEPLRGLPLSAGSSYPAQPQEPKAVRHAARPTPTSRLVAKVDAGRCIGCGLCGDVCPVGAVSGGLPARIAPAKCIGCGLCADSCPVGAISLGS